MTFPRGRLLELSGRVELPDGTFALRLGAPVAGERAVVRGSDRVGVAQRADWSDGAPTMLRFRADLRGTSDAFSGFTGWYLQVARGGVERLSYPLSSSTGNGDSARPRALTDAAVPLWGLVGADDAVAFSLYYFSVATEDVDVELPAAVLSGLVLDAAADPVVVNRVPPPGQVNVAVGGVGSRAQEYGLVMEVHRPSATPFMATPLTGSDVYLWVGGVLAWTSVGGDEPGFTTSLTYLDGNRTARFSTLLDDPLPQGSEVPVRVRVEWAGGGTLDESWSFFTEDLAAPELESALALSPLSVRAVWNEPVLAEDLAGEADALNPANWRLELLSSSLADGLPAVLPEVLSVSQEDGRTFVLALDRELTRGARYALVAEDVVDLAYEPNPVAPPDTRAEFVGFAPPQPALRRFSLLDWLPAMNVAEDETGDLRKFIACLQEVGDLLLADADRFAEIFDSDRAPERYLDAILQGLGNPFQFLLSEIDKRRLARLLVPIYQLKGTDRGIVDAVRFFVGAEVDIVLSPVGPAWNLGVSLCGVDTYLGGANLYDRLSFWVRCAESLTDAQRERIRAIVEYMKRAETHFRGFLEPVPEVPATPFWDLGVSLLGVDTVLGPG